MSSKKLLALALVFAPMVTLAAATWGGSAYFTGMATTFKTVINTLIPAFMGLGFIAFFWFLFKYLTGDAAEKDENKKRLLWSVIAIVIMISIFGVANLLQGIFGATPTGSTITPPTIM